MIKIAVLFTCYNRVEKTEECIKGLLSQKSKHNLSLDYYICDDLSTDGTSEKIQELLPEALIIKGNGNLFWSKGMYLAMLEAVKTYHDFYLMINDDMVFYEWALDTALDTYMNHNHLCGIVGCTKSLDENEITYGGRKYSRFRNIGRTRIVSPDDYDKRCDLANWNFFLLPNGIVEKVGLIDSYYAHTLGDFDYCIQMKKAGFPIYVASKYVGKTDRNSRENTSGDHNLKKTLRLEKYFSIKEHPFKYDYYFFIKNYGLPGIFYYFYLTSKSVWKILCD